MHPTDTAGSPPALSVVIPTLHEEENLARLLADLEGQRDIALEVIVSDGGSRDGTVAAARRRGRLPVSVVTGPAGRGAQLNRGAARARGEALLFLHADTRLPTGDLLAGAAEVMAREGAGGAPVAGHFPLRFDTAGNRRPLYFYEAKSCLTRPIVINGDQGMWMTREVFSASGGFDESLHFMEDARWALGFGRAGGRWVTLPGHVVTAGRRFETEGLFARQTLNAFVRCFDEIGFHRFFREAAAAYRRQDHTGRLDLTPFLALAHRLAARGGWLGYWRWWYLTGGYVRSSGWQLFFALDCALDSRRGLPPAGVDPAITRRWEPLFTRITGNPVGNALTMLLTQSFFYTLWAWRALARKSTGS